MSKTIQELLNIRPPKMYSRPLKLSKDGERIQVGDALLIEQTGLPAEQFDLKWSHRLGYHFYSEFVKHDVCLPFRYNAANQVYVFNHCSLIQRCIKSQE